MPITIAVGPHLPANEAGNYGAAEIWRQPCFASREPSTSIRAIRPIGLSSGASWRSSNAPPEPNESDSAPAGACGLGSRIVPERRSLRSTASRKAVENATTRPREGG